MPRPPAAPVAFPLRAYVGLGSNLGDGPALLAAAREALAALPGVSLSRASSLYLTEPQGVRDQPFFTNRRWNWPAARTCGPGRCWKR